MSQQVMRQHSKSMRSASRLCVSGVILLLLHGCGLFLSEDAQLRRAIEAEQRGDARAAAIDLKSLLEKHPENVTARLHLGTVALAMGDTKGAIRELERVQKASTLTANIVEPLARAYLSAGESEKALKTLDDYAANPASAKDTPAINVSLLQTRGEALAAQHKPVDAQEAFNKALGIAPNDVRSLLGLAAIVVTTEGAKAALAISDRALAAAPQDAAVHRTRGSLRLEMNEPEKAVEEFKLATAIPSDKRKGEWLLGMAGLAQAQLALRQHPEALATTEQMLKVAGNAPLARYMRAYALVQTGDVDKARPLLEQNEASGGDLRSRILLGAINLYQGRLNQAEMYLSSAVSAAPDNASARQLLAETRMRQAKPGDALDALAPALEASDSNASLLALAGRASLAAGQTQKGVDYLRRNAEKHPEDVAAKLDLAAGYLSAGQFDRALEILEEKPGAASGKTAATTEAQETNRHYLSVLARLKKGDTTGANAYATKIAREQPNNASAQALAGSLFATQGQYAQARPYLEATAKLRPDDAAGYLSLGRLELAQGHQDEARTQFAKALEKQPANATAAVALAMIDVAAGKPDEALKLLKDSQQRNPSNVEVRILQAQLLLQKRDLDGAEKLAREAVALSDSNASVLATLGRVLSVSGKHGEAVETFNRAVKAAPKSAVIRYQAAVAQRASGHIDQAIKVAQEALDIDPRYAPALQLAASSALAKGDVSSATKYVDALAKIAPEQAATQVAIGELRGAERRFEEAAAAFHKAGEIQPLSAFAIREFQVRKAGRLPSPTAPLEKFIASHPDDHGVIIVLAQERQQNGDRQAASRAYEQVIAKDAKNPVALNNLAWMHFEDGQQDALDLSRRAYEVAPNAIEIIDTHAWIMSSAGQAGAAVKILEKIPGITATGNNSKVPAEIVAHYAVVLKRAGKVTEAQALARDVAQKQMQQITPPMQKLIGELAKS